MILNIWNGTEDWIDYTFKKAFAIFFFCMKHNERWAPEVTMSDVPHYDDYFINLKRVGEMDSF